MTYTKIKGDHMKAVFAHDHIFKEDIEGNYYTGACYNNTVWRRYLRNFIELFP